MPDPIETLWGEVDCLPFVEPEEPLCSMCGGPAGDQYIVDLCWQCINDLFDDSRYQEDVNS